MTPRKPQTIELLAPARNIECGMEAILHGADAVYIGGPGHGARAAAGNSVDDIARLCDFAHTYGARIYVTLNTILYDSELTEAEQLVWQFYRAGVDALIVQDLSLLRMSLPPIALHASTQTDNCTPEKAQWLEAAGFRQIVLARELSLQQISEIAATVSVPLECFVHGALCVSYSGRCYASQHCFGRSANRGSCAQFCRLAFDLVDGNQQTLMHDLHLLSLRDMNRTASLEAMMDAGVRSFKIEGRLKDVNYVKNVTAWYRREIDRILLRRAADYRRASFGRSEVTFTPDVARSFNRGFTEYFLHGRTESPIWSFHSPKATGAKVGMVSGVGQRNLRIQLAPNAGAPIASGDGLCFVGADGKLTGFRVNRAEGNLVFPATMPRVTKGTVLFRNLDFAFDKKLSRPTATRTLDTHITLRETSVGYAIDMSDESGNHVSLSFPSLHDEAKSPQREAQTRQLQKLGGTAFHAVEVTIQTNGERFIPSSQLAEWRRAACNALMRAHRMSYVRDTAVRPDYERLKALAAPAADYTANSSNRLSREFYAAAGMSHVAPAFEVQEPDGEAALMTCRHCLRFALGACLKRDGGAARQLREPLSLRLPDGRMFPLKFDCRRCEMKVMRPSTVRPARK